MRLNSAKHILMHLVQYQKSYLLALLLLLLVVPVASRYSLGHPLLLGEESYYHLSYRTFPLGLLSSFLPGDSIVLLPWAFAFLTVLLFLYIAGKLSFSKPFVFFFVLFLILSPAFMYTFTTLSTYSLVLVLGLLAATLLLQKSLPIRVLACVPLALAAFSDLLSIALLATVLLILFRKQGIRTVILILTPLLVAGLSAQLLLRLPLVHGPFHPPQLLSDLVSDLGGSSGVGFALVLLSFIGIAVAWKQRLALLYLYIPLLLATYLYSTEAVVYLAAVLAVFAAIAFTYLLEREWTLEVLKTFTLLLVLLTMFFSAATYEKRLPFHSPTEDDVHALTWMKEHADEEGRVFSLPQNSYYVRHFAQRTPVYELHSRDRKKDAIAGTILNSTYITTTFPLLEEQNVSALYITPRTRKHYPADQGLLFVLKNERFKMAYSSNGYEVWVFKRA